MKVKENKYSYYDWKVPSGLLFVIIFIFILASFFLGYPSLFINDLKPTLLVKWDGSENIKVSDPKLYFWLINSKEQKKEALDKGVPSSQLVLDLRQGVKSDLFGVKQALFADSSLAQAVVGNRIQEAWFKKEIGRRWYGFKWSAEVVDAYKVPWWHSFDTSKVILLDTSRLSDFSISSDSLPSLRRKFLPAYELLVTLSLIICGLFINPFMFIVAIFIGSGYWHLNISFQQDFVLWGVALSIIFSHWASIWQRSKVGCSQTSHGILHAIFLWPSRILVASGLIYLAAWREDIGDFLIEPSTWFVTDPIEALTYLVIASILVWLTSFVPWFWGKIIVSAANTIPIVLFLSIFQLEQMNFLNLFSGGLILLLLIQLILIFLILLFVRFRSRSGHVHLGYFGFGNLGDDLLLICQLRRQSQTIEQTVIASNVCKLPLDSKQAELIFRGDLAATLDCLTKRKSLFLGPGGILQDKSSRWSLLYYISFGILARLLGCSWYWTGQGFSPLKYYSSTRLVLVASWLVSLIEVRDKSSYDYLVKIGVNPSKIEITRDLVWDMDLPIKFTTNNTLAVVLRAWEGAPLENWIKELSSIGIKRQYFLFEKDAFLEKMIRSVDSRAIVFVYRGDWRDFLRRFYGCSHILSMRFHGLILGLKFQRKCFSLAYDEKCELSEINSNFILKFPQWNTLFPYVKDFVETISLKRS